MARAFLGLKANERTYLAWLRTSLSIAAIGIAIQQLLKNTASQVIGYVFVILAAVFLVVATFRYFRMMTLLTQNKFETNRTSVVVITVLCIIAIAAALYALIAA